MGKHQRLYIDTDSEMCPDRALSSVWALLGNFSFIVVVKLFNDGLAKTGYLETWKRGKA